MGMNQSVYVGPFLKVTPQPGAPDWNIVVEEIFEAFYRPDVKVVGSDKKPVEKAYLLLLNHYRDRPRKFDIDQDGDPYHTDNIERSSELNWFQNAFKKDLDHLYKRFDKKNVEIMWGVVVHYL